MFMLKCLCCGRVKMIDETEDDGPDVIVVTFCPTCKERVSELVHEVKRVQAERN